MTRTKLGGRKLNGISRVIILKDVNRIDREPTEFEWKIFPGFTALGSSRIYKKF